MRSSDQVRSWSPSSSDTIGSRQGFDKVPSTLHLHPPYSESIWSPWSPLSSPNSFCTGSQTSLTPPSPYHDDKPLGGRTSPFAMCPRDLGCTGFTAAMPAAEHKYSTVRSHYEPPARLKKPEAIKIDNNEAWGLSPTKTSMPSTPNLSPGSNSSSGRFSLSPFSPCVPAFKPRSLDGDNLLPTSLAENASCRDANFSRSAEQNLPGLLPLSAAGSYEQTKTDRNLVNSAGSGKGNLPASLGPSLNNHKMELFKTELCRNWEEKGFCEYNM